MPRSCSASVSSISNSGVPVQLQCTVLSLFLIGFGEDLDLVGHHERRVESQSEMTDDRLVLVLLHKLLGAREGDLVDILVHLLGRHADTAVGHGQRFGFLVHGDVNRQVAQLALHFADRRKRLQLLGGVDRVRNQLAQENFMVRIEEFLDDGEDVLRRNSDFSVFHSAIVVVVFDFPADLPATNRVPVLFFCQSVRRTCQRPP